MFLAQFCSFIPKSTFVHRSCNKPLQCCRQPWRHSRTLCLRISFAIHTVQNACLSNSLCRGQVHYWFIACVLLVLCSLLCEVAPAAGGGGTHTNTHFTNTSILIFPGIHLSLDHENMTNLKLLKSNYWINFKVTVCGNITWRISCEYRTSRVMFHNFMGAEETLPISLEAERNVENGTVINIVVLILFYYSIWRYYNRGVEFISLI